MFQYNLLKVQKAKKHIVLPEGHDIRILLPAKLINYDIVDITLLGKKNEILQTISRNALNSIL